MAILVVTASPSRAGEQCVVEHRLSRVEHRSVFDSHGKARFRDLESGLYMVSYGNQTRVTDMRGGACPVDTHGSSQKIESIWRGWNCPPKISSRPSKKVNR